MTDKTALDHEKKRLHDSVVIIASEDNFKLICELMGELYHRKELCQAGRITNVDKELLVAQLKYHNERIKKLLML